MFESSLPVIRRRSNVHARWQLLSKHRELTGRQAQTSLFDRIEILLYPFPCPREDGCERSTHHKDRDSGVEIPDGRPCDCGYTENRGQVRYRQEQSCNRRQEGRAVRLDCVGDVEFQFDQIVEAWIMSYELMVSSRRDTLTLFQGVE